MFVQRQGDFGWLFYVFSQKIPSADKKCPDLKYDYTYIEQTDSVTVLSTLILPSALIPVEATISIGDSTTSYKLNSVYIEPKGKKFEYRLRFAIPMSKWEQMYESPNPFILYFTLQNKLSNLSFQFAYPQNKWNSNREKMNQIIYTVKLNTNK